MLRLHSRGFNLIELIIVLALISGALAMAAPAMGDWLTKSRQRNLAKAIAHAITIARTEAIKRNTRVTICISANQQTCTQSGGWEQGWIIFPGPISSTLEVDDTIIHHESSGTFFNLTATGNQPVRRYLSFLSTGRPHLLSGAFQAGTITVCAPGQNAINVVMAATGRTRIENTSTPCP
ncbi:MAG: GspH/FimT family pseudopilin [Proteobacteria bacterium]|nr:GspH/FimT family pseudopilin [Pseudomonadota bacterium]MCL2307342.1 GspH/FimT family pseudopilin [Pseudomonadota bacterium]